MNDWNQKLNYSLKIQQKRDIEILSGYFPDCVSVLKTGVQEDLKGIDYIVILRGNARIFIDAKTREKGCSTYWKHNEPELALEVCSVIEKKKKGWTLSTSSNVDYILYTFDKYDTEKHYLLPFQMLRRAFKIHIFKWVDKYGLKRQRSDSWHSSAVFVPVSVVLKSIYDSMEIPNN